MVKIQKTKQKVEYQPIEFYGEEYVKRVNEIKAELDRHWKASYIKNNDDDNDDPTVMAWDLGLERFEGKRP